MARLPQQPVHQYMSMSVQSALVMLSSLTCYTCSQRVQKSLVLSGRRSQMCDACLQMPSTPGQELTDKQLAQLLQKDPGEVAQQLLFLKGALLPAADLGLIIEWQPQLLLLEHDAALDTHLASLQQAFFSQQEDPQQAQAAFLSRHPVFLYAEEVSKALRALHWRLKVNVEAGDSMRGKIADNPDLLVWGLRQQHLMPVSNMTYGNSTTDWWTNLE